MLVHGITQLREIISNWKKQNFSIGFVPTMGALHDGHASLIKRACEENDKVVVSVFVNPTQFAPNEDYNEYPRTIDDDYKLCMSIGNCVVFNPSPSEMYYDNASTKVTVSGLTQVLCGKSRPTHFDGVSLVVCKLFNIVTPDSAYFGMKDAQQIAVIRRMVRDLNMNVKIIPCPIIRDEDGLAKSSRNAYLSSDERQAALVLNKSLTFAKKELEKSERSSEKIRKLITNHIKNEPFARIDYVDVVDYDSLESIVGNIEKTVLVLVAVYIGRTRLIDNFLYEI